jgi:phosphatidylinositol glycan class N
MIPFALISANLGILNMRLGVAPSALFMVVMAISDVLTLHFFWVVRDEGSWLEIGSTISHFVIASVLCVFVAALEGVSELFIAGVEVHDNSAQLLEEKESLELVEERKTSNTKIPRKPVPNGKSKEGGHST